MVSPNVPSFQQLRELVDQAESPCLSLSIPTERAGRETRQGPIHLKNLLREVRDQAQANSLVERVEPLIGDHEFWQHQGDGLALYAWGSDLAHWKTPIDLPLRAGIGDVPDVLPLLPLAEAPAYDLLCLSENEVRLFRATPYTLERVPTPDVPDSMAQVLRADEPEKQLQWHSRAGRAPGGAGQSAMFYGTGDEGTMEQHKTDLRRYFERVSSGLSSVLEADRALVLAGVDYLLPIFRQTWGRSSVVEVLGNHERTPEPELMRLAWDAARPTFEQQRWAQLERLRAALGTGKATSDPDLALQAAEEGRADLLCVALAADQHPNGIENRAVVAALRTGATVVSAVADELPNGALLAAVLRY